MHAFNKLSYSKTCDLIALLQISCADGCFCPSLIGQLSNTLKPQCFLIMRWYACFSSFLDLTAHSHVDASAHSHSQPIHKWKLLSAKCNSCMMDSRVLWHAKTPTRTHTYSHTHSDTHAHTHRHTKQQQSYHCMLPTGLAKEWVQSMRVLAMRQDTKLLSTPQSGRHSRARCTIQSTVQCMV